MDTTASGLIDNTTREKILDLSTSNREVLDLMDKKFSSVDLSPAEANELQYLFSVRQQRTSVISSLVRSIADVISSIIRNFRL